MNDDNWYEELMGDTGIEDRKGGRSAVHCNCGRFARYVSTLKSFNGSYTAETMFVNCARCGIARVELV